MSISNNNPIRELQKTQKFEILKDVELPKEQMDSSISAQENQIAQVPLPAAPEMDTSKRIPAPIMPQIFLKNEASKGNNLGVLSALKSFGSGFKEAMKEIGEGLTNAKGQVTDRLKKEPAPAKIRSELEIHATKPLIELKIKDFESIIKSGDGTLDIRDNLDKARKELNKLDAELEVHKAKDNAVSQDKPTVAESNTGDIFGDNTVKVGSYYQPMGTENTTKEKNTDRANGMSENEPKVAGDKQEEIKNREKRATGMSKGNAPKLANDKQKEIINRERANAISERKEIFSDQQKEAIKQDFKILREESDPTIFKARFNTLFSGTKKEIINSDKSLQKELNQLNVVKNDDDRLELVYNMTILIDSGNAEKANVFVSQYGKNESFLNFLQENKSFQAQFNLLKEIANG
ncbi:MAG: hypothetical protein H0T62_04080 [Parachlamydiaceae bacterium]|nr:hypothetical protein [Parachlamydiaceae bacterium]